MADLTARPCAHCGLTFTPKRKGQRAIFCSPRCKDNAARLRRLGAIEPRRCANTRCGAIFTPGRRRDAIFCSAPCAQREHAHRGHQRRMAAKPPLPPRLCPCGVEFVPVRSNANYCSAKCRRHGSHRLHAYSLAPHQYRAMIAAQGGHCALCPADLSLGDHIDHDHATGKVRGILCPSCNLMLGFARDNPDILTAAVGYLRRG